MSKETKFIQVGLKRKGRIVKNEQYTIAGFIALLDPCEIKSILPHPVTLFDRIFRPNRIYKENKSAFDRGVSVGWINAINRVELKISELIDSDKFGRKKK